MDLYTRVFYSISTKVNDIKTNQNGGAHQL
jgi:hypothetical protein